MKTRVKALTLLSVMLIMAAGVLAKTRVTPEDPERGPRTYSIKTFLNPNWEIAMHEVFTHYLQAASTFGQGDYQMTIAFLQCMEYYIKFLPDLIPNNTPPPDSKPINKEAYRRQIEELRQNTVMLRRMVEMKEYKKATTVAPDAVAKLCFDCHREAKVPPKWQLGGYKIVDE